MTGSLTVAELQSRIRDRGAMVLLPVFDEAVNLADQWLAALVEKHLAAGEPDSASRQRDALRLYRVAARKAFSDELTTTASRMLLYRGVDSGLAGGLSLLDDESLDLQLAHEHLAESLNRRHRAGISALDQRMAALLECQPFGARLPLGAVAIADAARSGIKAMEVESAVRSMVLRRFEELVSTPLFDLHKELNDMLARAGILPNLMVMSDQDERRRARVRSAQARAQKEVGDQDEDVDDIADPGPPTPVAPRDRELFSSLMTMLQSMRASAPVPAGPRRELSSSETLNLLTKMQKQPPSGLADALSGDGDLAAILKRELLGRAQTADPQADAPALASGEDTAVDLVGNLFDVLMNERTNADAVAPVLAKMVMPYVKATMLEPQLFEQPAHPARRLLNTVTEACEDNAGESSQDMELLQQIGSAMDRLTDEFDMDLATFERIERELSEKLDVHRRRFGLAERRTVEAQKGQERLEKARQQAAQASVGVLAGRELPRAIGDFLNGQWQHHLTMVALRQGPDSEGFHAGVAVGQRWMDLLDMASLGEPPSQAAADALRQATQTVLASSGLQDEAAGQIMQGLMDALSACAQGEAEMLPATPAEPAPITAPTPAEPVATTSVSASTAAPSASASVPESRPASASAARAAKSPTQAVSLLPGEEPPSEAELAEMRAIPLNTWVQAPAPNGELQVVKLSWVSGISGLMMFVTRRGARALVASPEEMVLFKRRGQLLVFDRDAPVDQALVQMANRFRKRAAQPAESTAG